MARESVIGERELISSLCFDRCDAWRVPNSSSTNRGRGGFQNGSARDPGTGTALCEPVAGNGEALRSDDRCVAWRVPPVPI